MSDELNALAGEAAAVDMATAEIQHAAPDEVKPEDAAPVAPLMSPEQEAERIVDLIAWAVKKIWPVLGYKPETKKEAAQKLAPLLVKYHVADTLFAKWGAEVEAGMFFFGVGYASYMAVKDASKEPPSVADESWWRAIFRKSAKSE